MITKYHMKIKINKHAENEGYNNLLFILSFTEDLDNFIRFWFDAYPNCEIKIEIKQGGAE